MISISYNAIGKQLLPIGEFYKGLNSPHHGTGEGVRVPPASSTA
jgi:hypothetical protein